MQELLNLMLFFSFLLPCVLILTFFDIIVCTIADAGIFKYTRVSSVFAIEYNS